MIKRLHTNQESGLILVAIMIVVAVLTLTGISLLSTATSQNTLTGLSAYNDNALLTAEAGIEQSLQQLNQSDSFAGYSTPQQFFNSANQGLGTYTTTITASPTGLNAKVITSTSKVYHYRNTTRPVSTKIVRVTAVGTSSPGYAVQTGPGGLILGGAAHILNSQVAVNGTINLSGAAGIGSFLTPSNVNVAYDSCPTGATPGATYPQVCSSGQPITLGYSTFIYGTVCATGQTSKGPNPLLASIQPGITGTGLTPNCTSPPTQQPTYDKAAQVSQVVPPIKSGTDNGYVCNSFPFNRTWPANFELTGNVTVNGICNVVIKGNVYITGDLNITDASHFTVDNSTGTTRPVIVVDGKITVNGAATIAANASGSGIDFYSFKSSAACGANCTTMSGNDLKTSSGVETVNIGGAAILPGMIFDAYWGKITVGGIGSVGSAIGQTVDMSGAGNVLFGTTLASGSHTWSITSYQQRFSYQP